MKTGPKIDETIQKSQDNLGDIQSVNKIKEDIPYLKKSPLLFDIVRNILIIPGKTELSSNSKHPKFSAFFEMKFV